MSKIRVALVEDDELTRLGLKTALQDCSETLLVGEALDGEAGLQLLQVEQPDVAIVDIGLPRIDGIDLTKKFRDFQADNRNFSTRILILTLQNDEDAVLAAFAAGADSYCMKDISFSLLLEAIRATHQGNSWIDPAIARLVLSQAKATEEALQTSAAKTGKGLESEPLDDALLAFAALTNRELEVLHLIVDGYSNAEIAKELCITVGTVKTHVRNILNKLCADDRTQAAVQALRSGLIN